MRRCGGSRSSRKASRGTGTPPVRNSASRELRMQRARAALEQRQHLRDALRHRHEMHAQVLRQRAHQRLDLLVEQPRHEPLERLLAATDSARAAERAPTRRRPRGRARSGSAVAPRAARRTGDRETVRRRAPPRSDETSLLGQPQHLRILRFGLAPPFLESRAGRDASPARARRRTRRAAPRRPAGRRGAPSAAGIPSPRAASGCARRTARASRIPCARARGG